MGDDGRRQIKWAARLDHVHEVTLRGSADLRFWSRRLPGQLAPLAKDSRAQVMIVAADSKYLGVTFREISISIIVQPHTDRFQNAAYLLRAFNSVRFFAFCERTLFSTPYDHAQIAVGGGCPVSARLNANSAGSLEAVMGKSDEATRPSTQSQENWEGLIYLPPGKGGDASTRVFVARISGETQTIPFLSKTDSLAILPNHANSPLQLLKDSQFTPTDWEVRGDAKHAKSKTVSHELYGA